MSARPCNVEDFDAAGDALVAAGHEDLARAMLESLDALYERHEVSLSLLPAFALRDAKPFPKREPTKKAARRKRRAAKTAEDLFS